MKLLKRNILLQKIQKTIKFLFISAILFLVSCSENETPNSLPGIDFGSAIYYDSFLFSESRNQPVTKTIKTKFNKWAVTNEADAKLIMVDDQGNIIGNEDSGIELLINGELSQDGRIHIKSLKNSTDTINLQLLFAPAEDSRNFSGFVQLENGNVERINNITAMGANLKIFQWNARQRVILNPLLKGLYWAAAIIIAFLLLWFVFLRNQIFPKMGGGRLTIETPYYKSLNTKGKRDISFTSKQSTQSGLNKILAGRKIYEVNPIWEEDVTFSPGRRNQIRVKLPPGSSIEPYTSKLKRGNSYVIIKDNLEIKLSYI